MGDRICITSGRESAILQPLCCSLISRIPKGIFHRLPWKTGRGGEGPRQGRKMRLEKHPPPPACPSCPSPQARVSACSSRRPGCGSAEREDSAAVFRVAARCASFSPRAMPANAACPFRAAAKGRPIWAGCDGRHPRPFPTEVFGMPPRVRPRRLVALPGGTDPAWPLARSPPLLEGSGSLPPSAEGGSLPGVGRGRLRGLPSLRSRRAGPAFLPPDLPASKLAKDDQVLVSRSLKGRG